MTKADIVSNISKNLGIEKVDVQLTVESLMKEIINSLESGENVYLRGFGSFIVKKRAEKKGRNIKLFYGHGPKACAIPPGFSWTLYVSATSNSLPLPS